MLIRFVLILALLAGVTQTIALVGSQPAAAHPGHAHGEEVPPPAAAAPRTETHSDLFEIVAVLGPDRRLWLYLDRHATAEPIEGATLELSVDGEDAGAAAPAGEGAYVFSHPALARPGLHDLVFTVTAGEEMDLLPATLEIPAEPVAAPGAAPQDVLTAAVREPYAWALAGALLLIGVAIGRAAPPRPLPPLVVQDAEAKDARPRLESVPAQPGAGAVPERAAAAPPLAAALLLLLVPALAVAQPAEAPRRQADGSVFVPKPTQRLMALRTTLAETTAAPASVQLLGQVIADPNASGQVQASQGGRIEPPEGGFPVLGQRVERGQVLGHVVPVLAAQDRVGVEASIAELDALIVIAEARVRRLTALSGTVAAREITDARAELEGLRQRRAATVPAVRGREPVLAPAAGVISVVRIAAGQVVEARETLFEVVDPDRLWVEAIAFDPAALTEVAAASARTPAGQALPLAFVGRGLTLRQQGLPLQFRITEPVPGLALGTPVSVTLRLYRYDAEDRPLPAQGAGARAMVLAGGRQATVPLVPVRDNLLQGQGDFAAAPGMRAVVTLTLPGQRPAQARFTPLDQD